MKRSLIITLAGSLAWSLAGATVLLLKGCSAVPTLGSQVSSEKNVWVEDSGNSGLSYCMSNIQGQKADPVCYSARRAAPGEGIPDKHGKSNSLASSESDADSSESGDVKGEKIKSQHSHRLIDQIQR